MPLSQGVAPRGRFRRRDPSGWPPGSARLSRRRPAARGRQERTLDPDTTTRPGTGRIALLDAGRGAAVIAMVGYHAAWDLSFLQLVGTAVVGDPAWNGAARTIAASFLALAGIGLALAHGRGVRPAAFVRRLGLVAAGAVAVSGGTWIAFPDAWVFFGILHNMVVSSILALPATRLPPAVTAGVAAAVLTAPLWLAGPVFDAPTLVALGLGRHPPVTNDWVPLLPWTGFVLAGVAAGRLLVDRPAALRRMRALPVPGALAWLGRHSLAVYLVHQPVLFGSLALLLRLTGPDPAAEARPFLDGCARSCAQAGGSAASCLSACTCTVEALKRDGLWSRAVSGATSPEDGRRIGQHARACFPAAPRTQPE